MNDKSFWQQDHKGSNEYPYGIQWGGWPFVNEISTYCRPFIEGKRVLEIGTGGGKWTKALFDQMHAKSVCGFDVHVTAVEETQKYEPRADVVLSQGDGIPVVLLEQHKPEIIFTYDVLLHLPQSLVFRYLSQCADLSLPIIFALPVIDYPVGLELLTTHAENKRYREPYHAGYIEVYSVDMIERMAAALGKKVKKIANVSQREHLCIMK